MRQELRQFILESFMFGIEDLELSDDDSLVEKGLIDSTGILELVAFIEEKYGVEIDDTELIPENFDNINALIRFLDTKRVAVAKPSCS